MTEEQKPIGVKIPEGWFRDGPVRQRVLHGQVFDWVGHIYGEVERTEGGQVSAQPVCVARVLQAGPRSGEEAQAIMRLLAGAERMMLALKAALPVLEWAEGEATPPEFVDGDPWAVRVGAALSDVREVLADIGAASAAASGSLNETGDEARRSAVRYLHRWADTHERDTKLPSILRERLALELREAARAIGQGADRIQRAPLQPKGDADGA